MGQCSPTKRLHMSNMKPNSWGLLKMRSHFWGEICGKVSLQIRANKRKKNPFNIILAFDLKDIN